VAESSPDVIVIGSGFGGLCCALILARHGKRVLVLEQHYRPGGYLHRFRHMGTWYDTGFHYTGALAPGQVMERVFRYLGIDSRVTPHALDPDGFDHIVFPDGWRFRVPVGHDRFAERLCDEFPEEAAACRRYVADMREMVAKFPMYNLARDRPDVPVGIMEGPSLAEYLAALTQNPRLRRVLSAQGVLYGVMPKDTPLPVHMLVIDSFLQSAWGIDGGGDALAQACVAKLRELGSEVRTSARVTAIEVDDARNVTGVVVDGTERIAASTVIAGVHPKALVDLVPEGVFRPAFTNRIREMKDGVGTFSVYLKTSADLSGFGAHNVYRLTGEDVQQAYTDLTAGPGRRPCIYYTVPSARDRSHTGEDIIVALAFQWYEDVARWAGTRTMKRPEDYNAFKMECAAGIVSVLEEELPELRDHILTVEGSSPLTNLHYTRNSGGAAYGIYHDRAQAMQALQPRTRVNGLLLTGHSVLLPGITGVALTAFYTCAYLLGFSALRDGLVNV